MKKKFSTVVIISSEGKYWSEFGWTVRKEDAREWTSLKWVSEALDSLRRLNTGMTIHPRLRKYDKDGNYSI